MTPHLFLSLYQELIEENPLAVRATLKILDVEFTKGVPTLAVTCQSRPRMLVNLDFVAQNCSTEAQVKALICHEFLHVLLRHTEKPGKVNRSRHIATDAVINAIIHRTLGKAYSSMMSNYYAKARGTALLLRPPMTDEIAWSKSRRGGKPVPARTITLMNAWHGIYCGKLVVDDIEAIVSDMEPYAADQMIRQWTTGTRPNSEPIDPLLIGNHSDDEHGELSQPLCDALDQSLREMNGHGIWRNPLSRGVCPALSETGVQASTVQLDAWRRVTMRVLKRCVMPDRRSPRNQSEAMQTRLPVLSGQDRRALLASLWLPYIPQSQWNVEALRHSGTTQVYLDVSGSMDKEIPHVVRLLGQLGAYIRRPLWAFSDEVAPARIVNGFLRTDTTGGTSMSCVLRHLARTQPSAAVIVTDGYIEEVPTKLLSQASGTRIHVLLTNGGSPSMLNKAGLAFTQLQRIPT